MTTRITTTFHGKRLVLALLAFAAAPVAVAVDDIEGPAGDLPAEEKDSGADGDEAPTAKKPKTPKAPPKTTKDPKNVKKPAKGAPPGDGAAVAEGAETADGNAAENQATWDSYADLGKGSSVAKEVTNGVRVEDIVEPPTEYRYAAFGKGDPFLPPLITEEDLAGPSALEIPLVSPLQRYALGQMNVVGIWQLKTGERKAMIMVNGENAGIIVRTGDLIGDRGGRILGIGEDYLNVREFSLAQDGSRRFEDRQMFMGKRPAEDLAGKIRFVPGEKKSQVIIDGEGATAVPAGVAAGDDGRMKARQGLNSGDRAAYSAGTAKSLSGDDVPQVGQSSIAPGKEPAFKAQGTGVGTPSPAVMAGGMQGAGALLGTQQQSGAVSGAAAGAGAVPAAGAAPATGADPFGPNKSF